MDWSQRGTDMYTYRYTSINTTTGLDLQLPDGYKEVLVHYEGSVVVAKRTGSIDGSIAAYVTSDGFSEVFPLVTRAGITICNIVAPSGTINVSVTAWK